MDQSYRFYIVVFFLPLLSCGVCAFTTIHSINGNVYDSGGVPLPGVEVSAWLNGTERVSVVSKNYGAGYESYFLLDVNAETTETGGKITFKVSGVEASESLNFTPLGRTDVNLTMPPQLMESESSSGGESTSTVNSVGRPSYETTTLRVQPSFTTTSTIMGSTTSIAFLSTSMPAESGVHGETTLKKQETAGVGDGQAETGNGFNYALLIPIIALIAAVFILKRKR